MTDPITSEIVRSYLATAADEMYEALCRSSPDPGINEAKDAGTGIYNYDGAETAVAACAGISVHSYSGMTSAQACLDFFHGNLDSGDVLLVSDSYHGGSHIGDYTVLVPVFVDGRPVFFTGIRAHMMDQGGPFPSPLDPGVHEIWHEGFRFAPLKLQERGEVNREVMRWLLASNRLPDMLEADLSAMMGAAKLGERRIHQLCDRYGTDVVRDSLEWIYGYSEQKFQEQIRSWPNGTYTAHNLIDTDFSSSQDAKIQATVTIADDTIDIDFSGTDPQSDGVINSVLTNTQSWIVAVFSALCPDIPINTGFFRPLRAHMPEGSLVNAHSPAPTSMGTVCCGTQIGGALTQACAQFAPERVSNVAVDPTYNIVFGQDERAHRFLAQSSSDSKLFAFPDMSMSGMSSGAAYGVDGWGGWSAPFSAGWLTNSEVTELQYPAFYHQAEYAIDSAAPGQWRGSPAYIARRELRQASQTTALVALQGLVHPLPGFAGGYEGAGNYIVIAEGTDNEVIVTENPVMVSYDPSATIFAHSGGGGGWGSPLDREPDRVLDDVIDEYVSIDGAQADYGVIIDSGRMVVLEKETARERAHRKTKPSEHDGKGLGRKRTIATTGIAHRLETAHEHGGK